MMRYTQRIHYTYMASHIMHAHIHVHNMRKSETTREAKIKLRESKG